jgi:type IV secretory pathway protease TraF
VSGAVRSSKHLSDEHRRIVIAGGEVFLMNWQSLDSLDGRYFGTLPMSAIVGKAEPLWTDEGG